METENDLKQLSSISTGINCAIGLEEALSHEYRIKYAMNVWISRYNFEFMSKIKIKLAKKLTLWGLTVEEAAKTIENIEKADYILIRETNLTKQISKKYPLIRKLSLVNATVTDKIIFPKVSDLTISKAQNIWNLECPQMKTLLIESTNLEEQDIRWLSSLKKLKKLSILFHLGDLRNYAPFKHLRSLKIMHFNKELIDLDKIVSKAKHLRELNTNLSVKTKTVKDSKLKVLDACLEGAAEKGTMRLRKVLISIRNVDQFNLHPEFIEEVEHLTVSNAKFDSKNIPLTVKKFAIKEFNVESKVLSRFD